MAVPAPSNPAQGNSNRIALFALLALLAAAAVFFFLRQDQPLDSRQLAAYLPANVPSVFFADTALLRKAGLLQKLAPNVDQDESYRRFVAGSGFEYARDLDQILVGFQGETRYAILQGQFDVPRIRRYAESEQGRCDASSCTISSGPKLLKIQFLRKSLIAFHTTDMGRKPHDFIYQNLPALSAVPEAPLWLRTNGPDLVNSGFLATLWRGPLGQAMSLSRDVLLYVQPQGDRIQLHLNANFPQAAQSQQARTIFELFTDALKKDPQSDPVTDALRSGNFQNSANKLTATWSLPLRALF